MDVNDKHNIGDILSLIIQDAGVMQKLYTQFTSNGWKEVTVLTTCEEIRHKYHNY